MTSTAAVAENADQNGIGAAIRRVVELAGGMDWLEAGQTVVIKPALNSAGQFPFTAGLSDRFGRRSPLIIALLVSALAALAVPFVQSLWPLALLWVFEAAAFAAAAPAEEALVVDFADEEHQGRALGFYTAAAGLGGVIGPLLGGWLYERFAAVGAFGISALLMAVGAGLIFLLVREPSRLK